MKENKRSLILEGGAMRGLFTCGVLDVFMENEIAFDGAAGISAGAVFGCNYKSHQPGRAIRYNKKYCRDPRYCSLRSLVFTGDLYGADFCYNKLPFELDLFDLETFAKDPMAFYIGATDVHTGEAVYHRCDRGDRTDMLWLRASASMPLVSRPVIVEGRALLDGGIADSIPYAFMEEQGYNRNIIILTQPEGYKKRPSSPVFCKLLQGKYPAIAQALSVRHDMYNQQLAGVKAREEHGVSLVIRPPEDLGIRRTENRPEELERVYQIGREEGKRRLAEVRQFTA